MDKSGFATRIGAVVQNVERVIFGKHHEVELALVALVCRGHILVEDVPGTGKTVLARAIARSLGCSFVAQERKTVIQDHTIFKSAACYIPMCPCQPVAPEQ